MTQTVLLTGAAGKVGGMLRPMLRQRYANIILSDRHPVDDLAGNESYRPAELGDAQQVMELCAGVDGIIHLGGQPTETDWQTVSTSNVQGMMNMLEASRVQGVKRFVFASSNHAVGMYPRTRKIGTGEKVRPDGRYGLSKAFGEAACALYADKHGLRTLSIRIGNVCEKPANERLLSVMLHPEDLFQLCTIGLEHPDLHSEIVFGASNNIRGFWDNDVAFRLGYRPKHRAEDFAAEALEAQKAIPADPVADRFQGGGFASEEFSGDAERALWN
ncbi:MAG: NAD(P)-dependent oxidoreductase [Pseudomonadota bacterium]